jgi:hypothetical protein
MSQYDFDRASVPDRSHVPHDLKTTVPAKAWSLLNRGKFYHNTEIREVDELPPEKPLTLADWSARISERSQDVARTAVEAILAFNPIMEGYVPPHVPLWRRVMSRFGERVGDKLIAFGEKLGGSSSIAEWD